MTRPRADCNRRGRFRTFEESRLSTLPIPPGLVTLAAGRDLIADLTRGASLPVEVDALESGAFQPCGSVILGDVPLHGRKISGRWLVEEAAVREAARVLAAPVDLADLVPPPPPDASGLSAGTWFDWRERLRDTIERRRYYPDEADVDAAWSTSREDMAGVQFRRLITQAGGAWCIPRGYAELLERWEGVGCTLTEAARRCEACGKTNRRKNTSWRVTVPAGYATRCPACCSAGAVPYEGEHSRRSYEAVKDRRRRGLADAVPSRHLCRLCPQPGFLWDHCHEHSYVRGPLCAGCNGSERGWTESAAGLAHLHGCSGCREANTLPGRHLLEIALERLPRIERHPRCRRRPFVGVGRDDVDRRRLSTQVRAVADELELNVTGRSVFTLLCWQHDAQWEVELSAAELLEMARAHMARIRQAGKVG